MTIWLCFLFLMASARKTGMAQLLIKFWGSILATEITQNIYLCLFIFKEINNKKNKIITELFPCWISGCYPLKLVRYFFLCYIARVGNLFLPFFYVLGRASDRNCYQFRFYCSLNLFWDCSSRAQLCLMTASESV